MQFSMLPGDLILDFLTLQLLKIMQITVGHVPAFLVSKRGGGILSC
jgi:hypothetical protein